VGIGHRAYLTTLENRYKRVNLHSKGVTIAILAMNNLAVFVANSLKSIPILKY
jgi:hypothetical protein